MIVDLNSKLRPNEFSKEHYFISNVVINYLPIFYESILLLAISKNPAHFWEFLPYFIDDSWKINLSNFQLLLKNMLQFLWWGELWVQENESTEFMFNTKVLKSQVKDLILNWKDLKDLVLSNRWEVNFSDQTHLFYVFANAIYQWKFKNIILNSDYIVDNICSGLAWKMVYLLDIVCKRDSSVDLWSREFKRFVALIGSRLNNLSENLEKFASQDRFDTKVLALIKQTQVTLKDWIQ